MILLESIVPGIALTGLDPAVIGTVIATQILADGAVRVIYQTPNGAASRDFFGTAYGQHEGNFDGFQLGDANVQLDDTLLLIEPDVAKKYAESIATPLPPSDGMSGYRSGTPQSPPTVAETVIPGGNQPALGASSKPHAFHGNIAINAATAKMRLVQVAEEIIAVLTADPNADVKVTVEIEVNFPTGATDQTRRAVTENARTLGFKNADWE